MASFTLVNFKVTILLTNIQAYADIVDLDQMHSYWTSHCHSIT